MELELKKARFDAYDVGGELTLTQEETAETIVPDYCPDIARIIDTEGKVYLHSRELRDGKAEVSGTIRVTVLYTPDGESGVRTLDFALPFSAESDAKAMTEAAEIGTRKVIAEHSTIGIVVTTDGSISDIPREDYLEAEERVIRELQELGKPFIVLLNSDAPKSDRAQAVTKDISSRYGVNCMAVNCLELDESAVADILKAVLYEFPMIKYNCKYLQFNFFVILS